MTLKNNRAPLLCCFQLCARFHCHMWIQTGVRVRKRLSWVLTSVTLTFDLWPWPFAWTSLSTMVITPENFMMIRWWEHGEKGVTDGRTDGRTDRRTDRRTDWTSHIAAWSQLKIQNVISTRYVDGMPTSEVTPVTIWYIHPPHHGYIRLFQTLTLKLQGQGHGWGQRSMSHSSPIIQQMHLLFVSHQSDNHSWDMSNSVWPWKNTSEIFKENLAKKDFPREFLQNLIRYM